MQCTLLLIVWLGGIGLFLFSLWVCIRIEEPYYVLSQSDSQLLSQVSECIALLEQSEDEHYYGNRIDDVIEKLKKIQSSIAP